MFIVTITYTQPIEAIEARTVEHRAWLDQHVASGLIIAGFLGGGIIGAWLYGAIAYHALLVPAALTGITGIGYTAYRHWRGVPPDHGG